MASAKGVGIPVKLLHEAEGHVITVELKSGENYRGELIEAEDNWNCQMKNVQATAKVRGAGSPASVRSQGAPAALRLCTVPDRSCGSGREGVEPGAHLRARQPDTARTTCHHHLLLDLLHTAGRPECNVRCTCAGL